MNNKKKLMYIGDEDFNYLTYLLVAILYFANSLNEKKKFKDYRKIALIIVLQNSELFRKKTCIDSEFKKMFFANEYYNVQKLIPQIRKILITLERKGFIVFSRSKTYTFDVHIHNENRLKELVDESSEEVKLLYKIKEMYPRFRTNSYPTMLKYFAGDNEVTKWEI